MTKQSHTPTPWHTQRGEIVGNGDLVASTVFHGQELNALDEANAAFIVRACNAHDELVDMAELLVRTLDYHISRDQKNGDEEGARLKMVTRNQVQIVLAKARGEA